MAVAVVAARGCSPAVFRDFAARVGEARSSLCGSPYLVLDYPMFARPMRMSAARYYAEIAPAIAVSGFLLGRRMAFRKEPQPYEN